MRNLLFVILCLVTGSTAFAGNCDYLYTSASKKSSHIAEEASGVLGISSTVSGFYALSYNGHDPYQEDANIMTTGTVVSSGALSVIQLIDYKRRQDMKKIESILKDSASGGGQSLNDLAVDLRGNSKKSFSNQELADLIVTMDGKKELCPNNKPLRFGQFKSIVLNQL